MSQPASLDACPVFGLTARFRSGLDRNETDVVWHDEVFKLITAAAGQSLQGHAGTGRLRHFGFIDADGGITKAGRAFLLKNCEAILGPITRAVLHDKSETVERIP